jgi:hypothetical protein
MSTRPSFVPEGTSGWPPVDRLGQKQPTRFNWPVALMAVPGMLAVFQVVPPDFWTQESSIDGWPVFTVACPCGETPRVSGFNSEECECGRLYLHAGKTMRVFRPEGVEAGVPRKD